MTHGSLRTRWASLSRSVILACLLLVATGASAAAPAPAIRVEHDRVSVDVRDVAVDQLLAELERRTGAVIHVFADVPAKVTASFQRLDVDQALKRLLGDTLNVVAFYTADPAREGASRLTEVWVLERGRSVPRQPLAAPSRDAATSRHPTADRTRPGAGGARGATPTPSPSSPPAAATAQTSVPDDAPALVRLTDGDATVRIQAASELADDNDTTAIPMLARILTDDPEADVRASVAESLARIKSPDAVAALRAALRDTSPDVRMSAVDAAVFLDPRDAIPILRDALRDPSEEIRTIAAASLENIQALSR